jgi:hypothetical protein
MKPVVKVTTKLDKTDVLRKLLLNLTQEDVYIGVPPEKDARPGSDVGNAYLSYMHEHGFINDDGDVVPPRPHLIPSITAMRGNVIKKLERAWIKTLQGDLGATHVALEGIGAMVANRVRVSFYKWRKLSLAAVAARLEKQPNMSFASMRRAEQALWAISKARRWNRKKHHEAMLIGKARFQPLVDTGTLRDAHDYVIRTRKGAGGVFGVLTGDDASAGGSDA